MSDYTDQSPDGHLTQAAWTVLVNTDRQNLSLDQITFEDEPPSQQAQARLPMEQLLGTSAAQKVKLRVSIILVLLVILVCVLNEGRVHKTSAHYVFLLYSQMFFG